MRAFLDALVAGLARLLTGIFFARVEVEGRERIPHGGPLLVVANHGNSLIDPALLLGWTPVRVRFLAKSTLWKHPVILPLVSLAGAIPVYRRHDAGADTSRNEETFARCYEVLAAGGAVALFPEGVSHGEPRLMPMKTGAARIVLGAEREFGPLASRILPLGLIFDHRGNFRSRALVQVGQPLDPAPEVDLAGRDETAAVRQLTERIGEALAGVTLNYDSWDEARLVERAADLYRRQSGTDGDGRSLAASFGSRQAFADGYRVMRRRYPERTAAVAAAVDRYDRLLGMLGLTDAQVTSDPTPVTVVRFVARTLAFLLFRLPLALVGLVLNWLPYKIPGRVCRLLRLPDHVAATYRVLISLVLFPLTWALEALVAGRFGGAGAALVTAGLAPLSGWVALRFHERRRRFSDQARGYLLLRGRRRVASELASRRAEVLAGIEELVDLHSGSATAR